ncbi:DUF2065 family protein [Pseudoroseicyclus tamaricis]|uniref:DUF2065 domain-containing protein n=1 Tax=Pseudoroseicyclus tamaricis TaxID=2705421 RepID=A0A6B2JXR5_9RHOB|nr:DUF2065 family protein [Pseudoroseicyclus tamaricis]NDV00152.1 DUF2065 domain-containing protein [Pseudoroseicyclus tamaricis]
MATLLLALGLLLVAEGLIWALAPGLIEAMLAALRSMDIPQRRMVGLGAMALGAVFVWAASLLGA